MPAVKHMATVSAPIDVVWDYIKEMGNWAPYLEGYQKHEEINEQESIWTLKGDVGVLCRTVKIKITITEWVEPQKVSFELDGLTEQVSGGGTFLASGNSSGSTELHFDFTIKAGGLIGPVANVLMKPMLKPVARNMGEKIKEAIEKNNA